MDFDEFGFLTPPEVIEIDLATFRTKFVFNQNRWLLHDTYMSFLTMLNGWKMGSFRQWIDGSFVTSKTNPNDLDIVTFLQFVDYEKYQPQFAEIERQFRGNLDLYWVSDFPPTHQHHFKTLFDELEWRTLFNRSRPDLLGDIYPKGFIEMMLMCRWKIRNPIQI